MRKLALLVLLLVLAFASSGCIDMKIAAHVFEDGSGIWEMGFHFNDAFLAMMGDEAGDPYAEFESEMLGEESEITDEATGITFTAEVRTEETEAGEQTWAYIVAAVPDEEAWGKLSEALQNMEAAEEAGEATPLSEDDLALMPLVTFSGDTIRVEFSGPSLAESMESEGEDAMSMDMFAGMGLLPTFTYVITLPGDIDDTNGEIDETTGAAVLKLDFESTDPLEFYAEGSRK